MAQVNPLTRELLVKLVYYGPGLGGKTTSLQRIHQASPAETRGQIVSLALRWLAGLIGILGLAGMTWQTLKIPNTQSATGILYVAVIFAFLGELSSQLLLIEAPNAV